MQFNGLTAYKGDKPYIFVSYAHADSEKVFPLLKVLQEAGYRIWFDQGIEAGTEWSNNIAEHLSGCSGFLFFVSKNSVKSENCLDEVAYAKSNNKQSLLAYLEEEVVLPSGTDMQTARFQRLYVNRQVSIDGFIENFKTAAIFDICRSDDVEDISPRPQSVSAAKPEKKKSGRKALAIVLVAVVVTVAVLAVVLGSGGKDKNTGNEASQPADTVESTEPEVVELSDSLEDNTFRLEGVVYRLPLSFARLTESGWTIANVSVSSDTYIGGQCKEYLMLIKDGKKVEATIYNDSENAKKVKDCQVVEIGGYKNYGVDFCIAGGITVGATVDELIESFGIPDSREDYDDISILRWYPSNTSEVKAYCYNDGDTDYNSISIYNGAPLAESVDAVQEAPGYLDDYSVPTELGSDLLSGIVSIEGDLYQLPVPLREFLDNGWTVSSGVGTVISGGKEDITLSKGECTIEIGVSNPSMYKTILQNCTVTEIWLNDEDKVNIVLPGGISFGMSKAEVAPFMPEYMEIYESSYNTTYSYMDYEVRDLYIYISVENETDSLAEIKITNEINTIIVE